MWAHAVPDDPAPSAASTASTRSPSSIPVAPAAHYASGGVRTDLRRPDHRARAVRVRRGGLHRRARRQPAGLQLAARGPGLRRAHRRGHPRGPAAPRAGPNRVAGPQACARAAGPRRRHGAEVRRTHDRRARACCASRGSRSRRAAGAARRRSSAVDAGSGEPCTESWEATNLLTVASVLVAAARGARGDPRLALARGLPRPRRRQWLGHLDVTLTRRGTDHERTVRTANDAMPAHTIARPRGGRAASPAEVSALIDSALRRGPDGGGDVTSMATIPAGQIATADLVARADGVVGGLRGRRGGVRRGSVAAVPNGDVKDGERVAPGRRADDRRRRRPGSC